MIAFLTFVVLFQGSLAFLFGASPEWDDLRVGFGLNPFTAFDPLPRTESAAVSAGWVLDKTVTCGGKSFYSGNRYVKGKDRAAMVLYDVNGYIAGIQAGIPKTETYPAPNKYGVFNEEPDMWVTTAYFVEPSTICTTGRTAKEYEGSGTGTLLAIQTGTSSDQLMRIPMVETDVTTTTKFVTGKCFYAMGMHYWYNLSGDMSCDDTLPVFLLYNKGKLNGFGWAFNPFYESSSRWEHPTATQFGAFMVTPPKCLVNQGHAVSTLHVYLTSTPLMNFC